MLHSERVKLQREKKKKRINKARDHKPDDDGQIHAEIMSFDTPLARTGSDMHLIIRPSISVAYPEGRAHSA